MPLESSVPTRVEERGRVVLPVRLVEVDGEDEARFVEQQRIDAGDEHLPLGVDSGKMPANDVVGEGQEAAVGATRRT